MANQIRQFVRRLRNQSLTDQHIIDENFSRFLRLRDGQLVALMNYQFFSGQHRFSLCLRESLEENNRVNESIRKKVYMFLANYVRTHTTSMIDHIKSLFSQLLGFLWKEQGRTKEAVIQPLVAMLQIYDQEHLLTTEVIDPQKLHGDLVVMLQTQKKSAGVIGESWYFLSVIQSKFPSTVKPADKRKVQQMSFVDLRKYVNSDSNFTTISSILKGLALSLRENYLSQELLQELFRYLMGLMVPLKATYSVPESALELLEVRRSLFHNLIMENSIKLFDKLREQLNHKNKQFRQKNLEVFLGVIEEIGIGIIANRVKYRRLFDHILDRMLKDLVEYNNYQKQKGEEKPAMSLITIIRVLGILASLYLQFKGMREYRKLFSYLMEKCRKKIIKDAHFREKSFHSTNPGSRISAILYSQKQLNSFLSSLAKMIQQLDNLDYDDASNLQLIFLEAVKQSPFFLEKYLSSLWESMANFAMSIHTKGSIFAKWAKKIVSESLRQCLDSRKFGVINDDDYFKMVQKSSTLWVNFLTQSCWRKNPLEDFCDIFLSNFEHLMVTLDCSYRIKLQRQQQNEQGIVQIFYLANENIEINKMEDYHFLNSLSLLLNQVLTKIDPVFLKPRLLAFYPQIILRLRQHPKCIPLMKTIRTLNDYIIRNQWIKTQERQKPGTIEDLIIKKKNFFTQVKENIFKYQQQYFYEALKMLLSFPTELYLLHDSEILKHYLPLMLQKTFQLGQEIVTLAQAALNCLSRIFREARIVGERHLSEVLPLLQKFISCQKKSSKEQQKISLLLSQMKVNQQEVSVKAMEFLGSIGGICHQLVDKKNRDYVSWDYYCKIQVEILLLNEKHTINLTKILSRVCWLALNGKDDIKIVASEFLHANLLYIIGLAANSLVDSKQNTSRLLDKVLPTLLTVSGNTSHPSQQLLHSLLIQTIHFFANTKQQNSPDVQTILKHVLALYSGAEDLSFLASKCLSQFVKWHIKQLVSEKSDLPVIKAIMRNIWSLVSNKKARDGLIHFMTKFLRIIHRQERIMSYYALEVGSLLVSLSRSNRPIEEPFRYLLQKYTLSLKSIMKKLIIEVDGRKYKKFPTIHIFLDWLYHACFFSAYGQQRQVSFMIWQRVIAQNQIVLGYSKMSFLRQRRSVQNKYLFGKTARVDLEEVEEGNLGKLISKITAYGQIWIKLLRTDLFKEAVIIQFKDLECVYMASFISLLAYLLRTHLVLQEELRLMTQELQESLVTSFLVFLQLLKQFTGQNKQRYLQCFVYNLQLRDINSDDVIKVLFRLAVQPKQIIPNFNYDLVLSQHESNYLHLLVNFMYEIKLTDPLQEVFELLSLHLNYDSSRIIQIICRQNQLNHSQISIFLALLVAVYEFNKQIKSPLLVRVLSEIIQQLREELVIVERRPLLMKFICKFYENQVQEFVLSEIKKNSILYQKNEKELIGYIVNCWDKIYSKLVSVCLTGPKTQEIIKLLYILLKKLNHEDQKTFFKIMPTIGDHSGQILKDLLKVNFLLIQNFKQFPEYYLNYIQELVEEGIKVANNIEIHQETLYLSGLLLHKCHSQLTLKKFLQISLNSLGNNYVPFCVSKLKTSEEKERALRYLKSVRNLIIISQDFSFIDQFFFTFKDNQLSPNLQQVLTNYVDDCITQCFCNCGDRKPLQWANWLISYYWNEDLDRDEWINYRLLIVDRILKKVFRYMRAQHLIEFFQENISKLEIVVGRPLVLQSAKSLILDFQMKKAALIIIQGLYTYMPKQQRQKKQEKSKNQIQIHKLIIKHATEIAKKNLDQYGAKLIKEHDAFSPQAHKGMTIFREYACAAYNCLAVIFIATQSNKEHFRSFLFQNNKQALWDNLIDPHKQDFGFEVETEFKIMKQADKVAPNNQRIKNKIKNQYFASSLYVIQEQNVPGTLQMQLQEVKQEDLENAQTEKKETLLQEDLINKHPCMVNLLRLIDHLHQNFYDGTTHSWMRPIDTYLNSPNCRLSERILLTKLIINRPLIFRETMWANHLLRYVSGKNTGGKFIHYFFRDAVKLMLRMAASLGSEWRADSAQLSQVVGKVVRALPHENNFIYSDNIDILEGLLKLGGAWLEKNLMLRMLRGDEKDDRNDWRMCAIIVLKLGLVHRIPVLSEDEVASLAGKPGKLHFYHQLRSHIKYVLEMVGESTKKFRVAGAGFLGEYLSFIFCSDLSKAQKQEIFRNIAGYISSINEKHSNRATKEKFTLALLNVVQRFPQILADPKLFAAAEDGLIHFQNTQREQILRALVQFCRNLLTFNESSKIVNIFMQIRTHTERILNDSQYVHEQLLNLLFICSQQQLLRERDIIFTYYLILSALELTFSQAQQHLAEKYYNIIIRLRNYLFDADSPQLDFFGKFKIQIHKIMVKGLGNPHQTVRKLIFSEFEKESIKFQRENIERYVSILFEVYSREHEEVWLINAVPLLISFAKSSSDYKRLLFQTKIEDKMHLYDWDFRNFKLSNASLPYTPAFTNISRREGPISQTLVQGEKLRGMIKASQNSYQSQQQQIFTLLASQSDQAEEEISSQKEEIGLDEKDEGFTKINKIFLHQRKRNKVIEDFKDTNASKYSPAVRFVQDKIRFAKNVNKQVIDNQDRNAKKGWVKNKEKDKRGALLRTYKIGQLPNIQISLQHLVQPMIYLSSYDFQFASQLFLQIFNRICENSSKNCSRMKETLLQLLSQSDRYQYNFISTLQKGLINICQKHGKSFDVSLKKVAFNSNTIDYAIIFTEQNIIQSLNETETKDIFNDLKEKDRKLQDQWSDLADYYQHLNQQDLIFAIVLKIADGKERQMLKEALQFKKEGEISRSKKKIQEILLQSTNQRFKGFLQRQKIDCAALLSEWEDIKNEVCEKIRRNQDTSNEDMKILTIALENLDVQNRGEQLDLIDFKGEKYEYELAIKFLMKENTLDKSKFHSIQALNVFKANWKKSSSFAFNSKHDLLQNVQKIYELSQFLQLYRRVEVKESECLDLFRKWSSRSPSQVYDSNITWVQVLSGRILYGKMLSDRWALSGQTLALVTTEWLIQVIKGMLVKGVLGYAENITRRALQQKKLAKGFNWQFYESISRLKLLQLIKKGSIKLEDYEIVPKLIQKELKQEANSVFNTMKLFFIKNQYLQGFLDCCLANGSSDATVFVGKINTIYKNYQQLRKCFRNSGLSADQEMSKQMHLRFALFLQKILSILKGKFEVKQIRDMMVRQSHLPADRVAIIFVEELIMSIKLLNLKQGNYSLKYDQSQQLFSLILKLLKIVQLQHRSIGKYFQEAVNDRNIPKWIFLYFIPQIIRTLNSYELSIYFKDLFDIILNTYPQSLVYPFNCSYPRRQDCNTEVALNIYDELHKKMAVNFQLIDNLNALQHPELRLKDILQKFMVPGESQNAMLQLKEIIKPSQYLGKYNLKFFDNWRKQIQIFFDLKEKGSIKQFQVHLRSCLAKLDQSKPQVIQSMKFFSKISDGSIFFQDYNSSDWNRLQVPGTSYCRFQEPHPWTRIFIESFDHSLLTLNSIRKPKRITILGSNEKKYMLLVKGGEDVRLDQRIEELFELINRVLKHSCQTSKKQLQIKRFEVVPMRKMFGVFEWVNESQTLRNFLEVEFRQLKEKQNINLSADNQAFKQFIHYFQKLCPGVNDKYVWHKTLLSRPEQEVIRNLNKCEIRIPYGLLRFALQKLSKNFDSFLHIKNSFISNYAACCLVTYILGIGDRHLDNFLIESSSASLVMIDFGYSFGASVDLSIPQLIPFRFTKSFRELIEPMGVQGAFKRSMVATFQALGKRMQLLVDYCDVFVDDPLMEWVWVSRKQLGSNHPAVQPSNQSFSVTQQPPQRKIFSKKIEYVQRKLKGYNPRILLQSLLNDSKHKSAPYYDNLKRAIWAKCRNKNELLSSEQLVNELISLATDKNIAGRSYIGLNMYV